MIRVNFTQEMSVKLVLTIYINNYVDDYVLEYTAPKNDLEELHSWKMRTEVVSRRFFNYPRIRDPLRHVARCFVVVRVHVRFYREIILA